MSYKQAKGAIPWKPGDEKPEVTIRRMRNGEPKGLDMDKIDELIGTFQLTLVDTDVRLENIIFARAALRAEFERLQQVEQKAIEQSEYIQTHGLSEYEKAGLEGKVNQLQKENTMLRGAMAADDERLRVEGERAGVEHCGCDTAHWMADEILGLRNLIIEADAQFNEGKKPGDIESAGLALVRMCSEGRSAMDKVQELQQELEKTKTGALLWEKNYNNLLGLHMDANQ